MNKVLKGYKTEIAPNNRQQTLFKMNIGACRWAFNWALERKKAAFDKKEKIPNNIELHRELNKLKGTDELPWAYEVSKCSFQNGLINCDRAFQNFFARCKKKVKGKKGFPKLKSKKNPHQSVRLDGSIHLTDNSHIKLPCIGTVKLKESYYIPLNAEIKSVTISSKAGKWYVSCLIEEDINSLSLKNNKVGVDLGIKTLATCSDQITFENPKALKSNLRQLKRLQRRVSRKTKGSQNHKKAKLKFNKLHNKISNIRKDSIHKATTKIVRDNQTIILEGLRVSNMLKNHCLAQAVGDMSASEFRRQIEYKAKWHGREVIIADTFYPSSKTCSCCGWKNENLKLKDRIFKCEICKNEMDRDLNAAINLKNYTVSSTGNYALGDGSSVCLETDKSNPSLKKESNGKFTYTLKRCM